MANPITGVDRDTSAALCYVLGPITGVLFFILDSDTTVRFHAVQSTIVIGFLIVMQIAFGFMPILSRLVPLISLGTFILYLVLIYKTWLGEKIVIPVLGEYAQKFLKKVK